MGYSIRAGKTAAAPTRLLCVVFGIGFLLAGLVPLSSQDLSIEELTNYMDGNWLVAGTVKNNGDVAVRFVEVELQGEDGDGNLVLTDTTYAFAPIPPHTAIPFRFINGADNVAGVESFRVRIADYTVGFTGTFEFSFEQMRVTERNDSFHKWSTRITNDSGQTRRFVNVAILGFDDDGELVLVEETYPNSSTLAAGATSVVDFLITPRLSRQVDRYRVLAYSGD